MEKNIQILAMTLPILALIVIAEKLYGHYKNNNTAPTMDFIASSYAGITYTLSMMLNLTITVISYDFLVKHFSIMTIESTWINYIIAFIVADFGFYWGHRLCHDVNFFWNQHLAHHSSEEFNYACSLRQGIFGFLNVFAIFTIPAAIFGVPKELMAFFIPINGAFQVLYHTRHIKKMGFLEHIIVTPSHHRVHHAMNPIYIDKNHGGNFIIWDKLFGTFQEELESNPPVYGITRPVQTRNPITINLQHFMLMAKDGWRSDKWTDMITIWFKPTGWRPEGFEEKYPINKVNNVFALEKFNPKVSKALENWSIIQFAILFLFFFFATNNVSEIGVKGIYVLVLFIIVQIISATEQMNTNKWAPVFSSICTIVCFGIYFYDTTWFGISKISSTIPYVFLSYFVIQTILAFKFSEETINETTVVV